MPLNTLSLERFINVQLAISETRREAYELKLSRVLQCLCIIIGKTNQLQSAEMPVYSTILLC